MLAFPMENRDLSLSRKLPGPPQFMMKHNKRVPFQVPPFFGFEHASTRWIIAMISTQDGLRRLHEIGRRNPSIFVTYYQIPDRPAPLMQCPESSGLERSAYNNKAILYLTPIALAVYLKKTEALRRLLGVKDEQGRIIVHPNTPCFVQKSLKRGMFRSSNDLCNTSPGMIAIRRDFPEALCCLMEAGYAPQKPFSVIYRKPYAEVVTFYRDIIDYAVDLLKSRPGRNLAHTMQIITTAPLRTRYDIFMYDVIGYPEKNDTQGEWVSVFRRIAQLGLTNPFFNKECGMTLIAVLEVIQKQGFFLGNFSQAVERETEFGYDNDYTSPEQQHLCRKINGGQILKMPEDLRNRMMDHDKAVILGILVCWYQEGLRKRRLVQVVRLQEMIVKILLDTFIIEIFFDQDDETLADVFTEWSEFPNIKVTAATVSLLRTTMGQYINSNEMLKDRFCGLYNECPVIKLNASEAAPAENPAPAIGNNALPKSQQRNSQGSSVPSSTSKVEENPLMSSVNNASNTSAVPVKLPNPTSEAVLISQSTNPKRNPSGHTPSVSFAPQLHAKILTIPAMEDKKPGEPVVTKRPVPHRNTNASAKASKPIQKCNSAYAPHNEVEYIRNTLDSLMASIKKGELDTSRFK